VFQPRRTGSPAKKALTLKPTSGKGFGLLVKRPNNGEPTTADHQFFTCPFHFCQIKNPAVSP